MNLSWNRRTFLKAIGTAGIASHSVSRQAALAAQKEIRIGIIGMGARGTGMLREALRHPGLKVTAVCDILEDRAARAQDIVEKTNGYRPAAYTRGPEDYRRLLEHADLDAVLLMTPQNQHGPQAIASLRAGKHVGSETPSAYTVEECWELVETREKTRRRYMLLENYPYSRPHMMILNMAHQGAFGEITYGECGYLHDARNLQFEKDGLLTWRGQIARRHRGDLYPTHGLGPMSLWMGINRGDRLVSLVSMDTGNKSLQAYAREHQRKNPAAAQDGFFQKRDSTVTLIQTALGRMITLRYDTCSPRPFGGWTQLQGTKASYDASPGGHFLYLEGRSPNDRWEPLEKFGAEFDHPYWRKEGEAAAKSGHSGGDYFVLREFFNAIAEDREPPIDVYDAAAWSAILPLSGQSLRSGNKPLEIPDFTRGAWKTRKLEGFGLG